MAAVPADHEPPRTAEGPASRSAAGSRWLLLVFVVLALLPLGASAIEVAPGWLPVGDDATIAMRGRDLLTSETPLLGMPSAVGEQTGRAVHHPGPLELWWVGVWERSLGIGQASMVAAALAWAAAVATALGLARRIGGVPLLGWTAVVASMLTWSLRGEVPLTPFNVHAIVVPLGAYLLALAAWHQRVRWAGFAAILLGSWSAQAHLTAVGPVVVAGAVAVGAVLLRHRRSGVAARFDVRRLALGAGVLALCWIGPIVDVATNGGGNVRAVLGARSDLASEAIGLGTAVDIVVRALAFRPVWMSAGAHPSELVLSAGVQHWLSAGAVVAVAVAGAVRRRRTHPALGVAVAATLAATAVGALLAARFPGDYLSLLALHNHLWLWPLTAVLWGAALVAVGLEIHDLAGRSTLAPHLRPAVRVALPAVVLLAVGAASLGEPHRDLTLAAPSYVRTLGDGAVEDLDPDGTYRLTISGEFDNFFVEVGLLAYLEDAGVDVLGPERYRQAFGERRTTPAAPLDGELVVDLAWDDADLTTGSGELLAEHIPPPELLRERRQVEDRLVALLRRGPTPLPLWGMAGTDEDEVRRWVRDDLDGHLLAGFVPAEIADAPETREYLDLRRRPVLHAAVHLVPAG